MVKHVESKTWDLKPGTDGRRRSTDPFGTHGLEVTSEQSSKSGFHQVDDTPLDAILHPDLRDADGDDLDDLFKFVTYCKTGDKKPLKGLSLDRLDVLFARYGGQSKPHVRALTIYRDELRDKRSARISRREKVGLAILATLLGILGGLFSAWLKLSGAIP